MRILIWNMQAAFGAAKQEAKWRYLEQQTFDIALLQETPDPAKYGDWRSSVWRRRYSKNAEKPLWWGSAEISRSVELEEPEIDHQYPWLNSLRGSTAIARTPGRPAWFASVHASATMLKEEDHPDLPLDQIPRASPDRSLWQTDVIPFELSRRFGDESFVWGGDLNSAVAMDKDPKFCGGNGRLREFWAEAGSHDLRLKHSEEECRTFFSPNRGPYQLDHVFGDIETAERVSNWLVDKGPVECDPPLSDHAPIIVEIDTT